ncbi:lysine-specific demethylase 7A isoform X2 [Denticeps clupeoides]|uniref:lysine-specific demethylase 7A isoform X2 n=1 Tax=Denticeps clupeoides TaxID=299321 RepID=UPI0010A4A456|nr:lysine-specific demethylase 7B-like isoform X2 [Denticeps clupeoides]
MEPNQCRPAPPSSSAGFRRKPSPDEIVVRMQGSQVTPQYLERQGFSYPIMVPDLDGLGLKLPPPSFSVEDVEQYVGGSKVIDVIDVARQADSKMKLGEFVKYYYKPERPKVLNVISLEFSDTKMANLVVVPDVAQKMSWVENYWPDDSFFPKPFVQKYCLMGVKDSYTDFHVDFGGTSVWYHVLWGEKIFYLIEPTEANLALYEAWSSSFSQSEVFFGEKVDKCYKCVVQQGTTLLIPTGWIHAVLTSQDCMAFGGNFLHNLNICMQLRCYEMERRLKTPDLFKFPYFEAICWYVAKNLLDTLRDCRDDNVQPQAYLVEGVKALIIRLKTWLKREVTEPSSEIPDSVRPNHLIKELSKEIRHLEEDQGNCGMNKPMKSQVSTVCPLTRGTLERGCQSRRVPRKLRDHPKLPSNLDILEQHTREVLKRLEVGLLEEDPSFNSMLNIKFNNVSMASAATAERGVDNNLRLRLCNGRIVRDPRPRSRKDRHYSLSTELQMVKMEKTEPGQEVHRVTVKQEKPDSLDFLGSVHTELRGEAPASAGVSDDESEDGSSTERDSSEDDSRSSEGEKEDSSGSRKRDSGNGREHQSSKRHKRHKPLKRERPTSPSTEEAIEGMLSMAGLLYPPRPEEGANSQEPWWSSPSRLSPEHQGDRQHYVQAGKGFMDSQGNSSSEAWDSPLHPAGSPGPDELQYRESSTSPPLHPSKRQASNPPPISNQATKGKRPKKGMATAKQRLGKILKLSRHNRLFV